MTLSCANGNLTINGNCCTGGTRTTFGSHNIHTFTSTGTFSCLQYPITVRALVIAGGGGGGKGYAGGGGAGGMLDQSELKVSKAEIVSVGAGGLGSTQFVANQSNAVATEKGANGQNSSFLNLTAIGGGGGGSSGDPIGSNGGSGGGSGGSLVNNIVYPAIGGLGTPGQGNNGGSAEGYESKRYSASSSGGGGAGFSGHDAILDEGSAGGNGLESDISGSNITYAGGGGGGSASTSTRWPGGSGGGGGGGTKEKPNDIHGEDATFYGSGGGGGGYNQVGIGYVQGDGGDGFQGIVIIRH